MQSFTPRTSPPLMRRTPQSGMHTPPKQYGAAYTNPQNPVDRAMMHNFNSGHALSPGSYGHFSPSSPPAPHPHYTPHPVTLDLPVNAADHPTPYQQQYHYDAPQSRPSFHFPFRSLMIILVTGALAMSIYAAYRAFTNPSPVNAGFFGGWML